MLKVSEKTTFHWIIFFSWGTVTFFLSFLSALCWWCLLHPRLWAILGTKCRVHMITRRRRFQRGSIPRHKQGKEGKHFALTFVPSFLFCFLPLSVCLFVSLLGFLSVYLLFLLFIYRTFFLALFNLAIVTKIQVGSKRVYVICFLDPCVNMCPRRVLNLSASRPELIHVPACVNFDFPGLLNPLQRGAGGQRRQVKNTACFSREP